MGWRDQSLEVQSPEATEAGQGLSPETCNPTREKVSPSAERIDQCDAIWNPHQDKGKSSVFYFKNQKSQIGLVQLPR